MTPQQIERMIPQAETIIEQRMQELEEKQRLVEEAERNLSEAHQFVLDLRAMQAELRNGGRSVPAPQTEPKRPPSGTKKISLSAAQNQAIDAVQPGTHFGVADLFDWCLERYPGQFGKEQFRGFTSMFAKKRRARGDIERVQESVGNEPAVYRKEAKTG